MNNPRPWLMISLALNLALALGILLLLERFKVQQRNAGRAAIEAQTMAGQVQELEAAAKARAATAAARSEAELLDLARLRAEVTRLRREQAEAKSAPSAAAPARAVPTATVAAPTPTSSGAKLTSTVSASIGLGHSLAVGGWISPGSGKRIVGLITPELAGSEGDGILVTARLIELSAESFEQLGLGTLRTDQPQGNGMMNFTPEQSKFLLETATLRDGTDVLAVPRVVTLSGREAQVSLTQARPDGSRVGPVINITPTLAPGRTAVRLDLKLELNLPPATAP